jgi:hypothetical protein
METFQLELQMWEKSEMPSKKYCKEVYQNPLTVEEGKGDVEVSDLRERPNRKGVLQWNSDMEPNA